MEFLLYIEDRNKSSHLKMVLENTYTCNVTMAENYSNYIKAIEEKNFDLNIFSSSESMSQEDIDKAKKFKSLFLIKEGSSNFKNINNQNFLNLVVQENSENLTEIFHNINKLFHLNTVHIDQENIEYYPVRLDYLDKFKEAPTDVFIKLSENKFLKLIKKNSLICEHDFENLKKKNVSSLFIHQSEFEIFLSSFKLEKCEEKIESMVYAQEVFQHFSSKIGLNEKAMFSANKAMNYLYDYMDEEPHLKKMWEYLMKNKSPMAEHSLMLGYLSAGMLGFTKYNNENNSIKLTLAALLHDSTIVLEEKFIFELKGFDKSIQSKKEIDRFKEHVSSSIDVLDKFENAPMDVDKILLQHHEKYDGSGFPRGLTGNKIPILSALFIVAHEFVIELMNRSYDQKVIDEFFKSKQEIYLEGTFKEALDALIKTV